jgi:serine/threonine protein kinase
MAPEALSLGIYSRASDMWSAGVVVHMLVTGGDVFDPLNLEIATQASMAKPAHTLLYGLLKGEPTERLAAAAAANECRHWIGAMSCMPLGTTDNTIAPSCQPEKQSRAALCSLVEDKHRQEHPCARASFDYLPSVTCLDVTGDAGAEFAIFNDFHQTIGISGGRAKQHEHEISNGLQGEMVLKGAIQKPSSSLCQSICRASKGSKENRGPGAPRVCKHGEWPTPGQSKVATLGVSARRPQLMR